MFVLETVGGESQGTDKKFPLLLQRLCPRRKIPLDFPVGRNFQPKYWMVLKQNCFSVPTISPIQPPLCSGWVSVEFHGGILQSRNRIGIMQGMAEGACPRSLSAISSQAEEAGAETWARQVPLSGYRVLVNTRFPKQLQCRAREVFMEFWGFFSIQSSWNNPTWCVLLLRAKLKSLLLLALCQCVH